MTTKDKSTNKLETITMMNAELDSTVESTPVSASSENASYEEFEIGEHKVPWFLKLFFILIITWASISWIKFFGY